MTSQIIELSVLNNKTVSSLKSIVDSARNRRRTMVDKSLTIFSLKNFSVKRSPRARNDKSNNWIIRFKQQNGKFTKVCRRIRRNHRRAMVYKSLTIFSLKNFSVKRSPRARNDKLNKWIIRFKQQNGKFTKVHRRFLRNRRCTMLELGIQLFRTEK